MNSENVEATRNGSTSARAILEDQSVWRRRECPGWTVLVQFLLAGGPKGRRIDRLILGSPTGATRVVHFDVTANFQRAEQFIETGKWPTKARGR